MVIESSVVDEVETPMERIGTDDEEGAEPLVRVEKGGHGLHHRLVQTLADRPELLEDRTGGRSISRRNPPVRVLAQR